MVEQPAVVAFANMIMSMDSMVLAITADGRGVLPQARSCRTRTSGALQNQQLSGTITSAATREAQSSSDRPPGTQRLVGVKAFKYSNFLSIAMDRRQTCVQVDVRRSCGGSLWMRRRPHRAVWTAARSLPTATGTGSPLFAPEALHHRTAASGRKNRKTICNALKRAVSIWCRTLGPDRLQHQSGPVSARDGYPPSTTSCSRGEHSSTSPPMSPALSRP